MTSNGHDKDHPEPSLTLLIKLMKMTTVTEDTMALVAIRKANNELKKFGGDWEKLLQGKVKVIGDPFATLTVPPSQPTPPRPAAPTYTRPTYTAPQPRPTYTPPPVQPRTAPQPPPKIVTMPNKFDGLCAKCGSKVLAGEGEAIGNKQTGWRVEHLIGQCNPATKAGARTASKRVADPSDLGDFI